MGCLSRNPYLSVLIGFVSTCNKRSIFLGWVTLLSFHAEYDFAEPASVGEPATDELAEPFQAGWIMILINRYLEGPMKTAFIPSTWRPFCQLLFLTSRTT
jgi:hypothetical protein